jgi:hypothetical protein
VLSVKYIRFKILDSVLMLMNNGNLCIQKKAYLIIYKESKVWELEYTHPGKSETIALLNVIAAWL